MSRGRKHKENLDKGVAMLVNRWKTRGGRYWFELYRDEMGFTYKSDNGGGNLGNISEEQAYQDILSRMIDSDKNYKIEKDSDKATDARNRIDKTKALSLDERINVIQNILDQLNIKSVLEANARVDEICNALDNLGYLPMMFNAACRVWASRHREKISQ